MPDTQSQMSSLVLLQDASGSNAHHGRTIRASVTVLGLALSLSATGSFLSSAEAADSFQLAALPSVSNSGDTLPSFGSSQPAGNAASYHTVIDGETIWDIAKQHGITVDVIKAANGIAEDQVIQAGQVLKVPTPTAATPTPMSVASRSETTQVETNSDSQMAAALQVESTSSATLQKVTLEELQAATPQAVAPSLDAFLEAAQPTSKAPEGESNPVSETSTETMAAIAPEHRETLAPPPENNPAQTSADKLQTARETSENATTAEPSNAALRTQIAPRDNLVHRVGSGETVWSIARSYGIDPDDLQAANDITDPTFIVPGDELALPAHQALEVTPDPEVERLSRRQAMNDEQRLVAVNPVIEPVESRSNRTSVSMVASPLAAAPAETTTNAESESDAVAIADPFVEGMLSDVAATSRSQLGETVTEAAQKATALSNAAPSEATGFEQEVAVARATPANAINPQFSEAANPDAADVEPVDADTADSTADLLAAAPLGSEVYAPVVESPAGQIVSPEMPVLPSQDEYLPEAPNRFEGYIWPAQGVLTSGFGWRWGRMHNGVDIAGPVGTPIYAAGPGVVVSSGWNSGGYGNMVDIRHPDGSLTRYAHNSRLMVSAGQQVRQGQQIAEMGSTGYSTGPHLHFEIHIPERGTVNPIALLPGR